MSDEFLDDGFMVEQDEPAYYGKNTIIPCFDEKVEKKMAAFMPYIDQQNGANRMLVADSLYDYCRISVMLDDVTERVLKNGYTIVNNKGRVERNPDVMTMHQMVNEKNALYSKILRSLPKDDREYVDELAEFVRK